MIHPMNEPQCTGCNFRHMSSEPMTGALPLTQTIRNGGDRRSEISSLLIDFAGFRSFRR